MNNMEIFKNEDINASISVTNIDGDPWFVAKDIAEVLSIKNLSQALSRLDADEKGIILNDTLGGTQKMSIISESGMYGLVLSSRKPEAKEFQRWVRKEVLPAIRKNGGYIIEREDDTPEEILARALIVAKEALKRRDIRIAKLESVVEESKPMVDFANQVANSSDAIDMGDFSKVIRDENIDMGRNKLFSWLRDNGILMKKNVPYQKYIENKWFTTQEITKKTSYGDKIFIKTLITGLGQIKVLEKIKASQK